MTMETSPFSPPLGGLTHLRACLAADGQGDDAFLVAEGGLAADGHGGDALLAAAGGLAILRAIKVQ
jgi:hypothetical protein